MILERLEGLNIINKFKKKFSYVQRQSTKEGMQQIERK